MDTNISIICQAAPNRRQNNRKRGTSNLNRIKSKTPFESKLNLFAHTYLLYKVFETHSQPVSTVYINIHILCHFSQRQLKSKFKKKKQKTKYSQQIIKSQRNNTLNAANEKLQTLHEVSVSLSLYLRIFDISSTLSSFQTVAQHSQHFVVISVW